MNPATEALNEINELTVEPTLEEQTEGQFDEENKFGTRKE